jgi:hypothetical protein
LDFGLSFRLLFFNPIFGMFVALIFWLIYGLIFLLFANVLNGIGISAMEISNGLDEKVGHQQREPD